MAAERSQSFKDGISGKEQDNEVQGGLFGNDKKAEDQRTSRALLANHQSIAETLPVSRQPSYLKNIACTPFVVVSCRQIASTFSMDPTVDLELSPPMNSICIEPVLT